MKNVCYDKVGKTQPESRVTSFDNSMCYWFYECRRVCCYFTVITVSIYLVSGRLIPVYSCKLQLLTAASFSQLLTMSLSFLLNPRILARVTQRYSQERRNNLLLCTAQAYILCKLSHNVTTRLHSLTQSFDLS